MVSSADLWQSVFHGQLQGVLVSDAEGSFSYANPAVEQILGIVFEQLRMWLKLWDSL